MSNNWKFTGRLGVQSFEGARIPTLASIQPFTQPIARFDLDRMDDNDNRLFGVTAEIMWLPKPAYQLTVRTPLCAIAAKMRRLPDAREQTANCADGVRTKCSRPTRLIAVLPTSGRGTLTQPG